MKSTYILLVVAMTAITGSRADCIAPYHRGCDAQTPCCNNMMCSTFEGGPEKGFCTHWLTEDEKQDVGSCTPGCEACCNSSGSRYAKHCVKVPGTDRGSCRHWLMEGEDEKVQDLKPGCIMAGYKGCKTSHDCCGVTGSLDGLVCGRDGVCHPLMPNPYPLPPFSLDKLEVEAEEGCTPGCEACCHSTGSRYEMHCVKPYWSDRGRCQHWLMEEEEEEEEAKVQAADYSDYCKPGCEACCDEDKGSQYGGFHCMPLSKSRGMCMPWFKKEETSKDCVTLDGCQKAADCCNKGFMCAHFAGRDSGRCMPWLQETGPQDKCVVGYGCQEASECCEDNYQCLHTAGKEFGTCLPYF